MNLKESIILEYIILNKIASVEEMSHKLHMSLSTVRRTLAKLDQRKLIVRYHGGASSLIDSYIIPEISNRYKTNMDKKEVIAKKASEQIHAENTIIMLGGTTVFYMCKYIKNMKLRVITNSFIVIDMLKQSKNIELVILGGIYSFEEEEVKGSLTNYSLQHLGADLLFTSATAFDVNRGFLTSHIDSIELYSQCIQIAQKNYMLIDSTKYGKNDVAVTARVNEVDYLISDEGLDGYIVKQLMDKGVKVLIAESKK